MLKRILNIAGFVAGATLIFVLLVAAVSTSFDARFRNIEVKIGFAGENFFFDRADIEETVFDLGYRLDSSRINDINPANIELLLKNNPFIREAEVYKEINGSLHIDVIARQPVVRVYNDLGRSVYIDKEGMIMPLSTRFAARTPIANGHISLMLDQYIGKHVGELGEWTSHPDVHTLQEIYHTALTCHNDPFWSAQISQMYVNPSRELELIPRVGDHRILIGHATDLEKKLVKLRHFYDKALSKTGWNEYKIINLKYANQVVCTKS